MSTIVISTAQMTALDTAGVFEVDEADGLEQLRGAIGGNRIHVSREVALIIHELANHADRLGDEVGRHDASMYRADSRSLTALALKVSKSAAAL